VISKAKFRAATVLVAAFLLSGCLDTMTAGGLTAASRRAPQKLTVAAGAVTIAAPPGYCINTSASQDSSEGAFVLLGSCRALRGLFSPAPADPAILTASVSGVAQEGDAPERHTDQLERYFRSRSGQKALSRSGDASTVSILATDSTDEAFFVQVRDTSDTLNSGLNEDYWRALIDVNGYLITASVMTFDASPMTSGSARQTLERFTTRLRRENEL
jgi:hypothetical protein